MSKSKTPLFFHLAKSNRDEPPVQNEEFLRSYIQFGSGLRSVNAFQQYRILQEPASTPLERFAAVCAFYQALGMLYEDLAATTVAWTVWAKNRSLLLADIYERIFLTSKPDASDPMRPYYEQRAEDLATTTKSVRVCGQQFFESLSTLTGEKLLHVLGIPWKQFPSVKLVPRNLTDEWNGLPEHGKQLLRPLADKKSLLLNTSHNKLKHGPQMVVMNPCARAVQQRGVTEIPDNVRSLTDQLHVRLLFDGARTQETLLELENGKRVAPFLLHQPDALEGMLINLVSAAHVTRLQGWWLYRCVFGTFLPNEVDPIITEIAKRFRELLKKELRAL